MKKIKALFLDIGGVLMTNGWDRHMRDQAIKQFHLEKTEFEILHKEWNPLLETDRITLDEYLDKTIFWKTRNFTHQQFKDYMFSFSLPHADMLRMIQGIKEKYQLQIAFISNEGRELANYRMALANLQPLGDYFFISCFVYLQKPDPLIYRLALDVTQYHADEVFFVDDRQAMVDGAASVGIAGIVHESLKTTEQKILEIL